VDEDLYFISLKLLEAGKQFILKIDQNARLSTTLYLTSAGRVGLLLDSGRKVEGLVLVQFMRKEKV
jgi:hypothetical protein